MSPDNVFLPKNVFFTKGVGKHKEKLSSFEDALRSAGIEKFNLVRVSSILPPRCNIITREKGLEMLEPGQIVFVVIAQLESNEPNRLMAASIGMANPANSDHYGYLSEHHSFGQTEKVCGEYAEDLAAKMLASTLGIEFNVEVGYDAKKDIFKMGGHVVKTRHITQSAICDKNGLWTTVISAAVFVF
ncbi:MAG: arginine decarboxylase, pyruvoyl-dependent [Candidatus Thermoplasmatota archaeon]|nr:arginine decarboxylase, pyruvoyl-dependent [Euryarchaeota archaeon]MBU4031173.1 arginine decarboxylase, pyruvoyl-dependent [Candidatus Thermoplasmatota archaeon]MBU4071838.1 arginine decarboxylase, pyruvoyl-dependent [Candidatus Thermoplasmatota archaeon]MBU4144662.1 arginine decarboxylase, pyruvoyl-dependent [Candidatus Thermoplasmatota archaeon]MBU4592515.1 arginine decarboxylase, pyruvoyl-dependent [Candidatus Thermoplasmatota archaeon]